MIDPFARPLCVLPKYADVDHPLLTTDSDIYARRMSTSAESLDSELDNSPSDHGEDTADHPAQKVQLPSIYTAFDDRDHARPPRYQYPRTHPALATYQFPPHMTPHGEYNDSPYTPSASSAPSYVSYGYGPSTGTPPWPLTAVSRPSSTGSEIPLSGQDRRYSAATGKYPLLLSLSHTDLILL